MVKQPGDISPATRVIALIPAQNFTNTLSHMLPPCYTSRNIQNKDPSRKYQR